MYFLTDWSWLITFGEIVERISWSCLANLAVNDAELDLLGSSTTDIDAAASSVFFANRFFPSSFLRTESNGIPDNTLWPDVLRVAFWYFCAWPRALLWSPLYLQTRKTL